MTKTKHATSTAPAASAAGTQTSSATGNTSPAANKVNGEVLLNELTAAIGAYVVLGPAAVGKGE